MHNHIKQPLQFLTKYFWTLPVIYMLVAIFLLRGKVQYIYIAVAILIALTAVTQKQVKYKPEITLARWLVVLAAIGVTAAMILSIEKIELLTQPDHVASCSLSPVVACSPVIASDQASAFGFPNSFIGLFGFAAVLTAGMTIAAGAVRLTRQWWLTLLGGISFGVVFSMWLIYQGVFVIGKLCLYCMLVWLVSFAMLWLVTAYCIDKKYLNLGPKLNQLLSYKHELIATTYAIIFMIILYRWSDYWFSLI